MQQVKGIEQNLTPNPLFSKEGEKGEFVIDKRLKMFILSNFITAIAKILDIVLSFYYWVIIIRALISWVNPDPYNPIVQFLYKITEPVLSPVRRWFRLYNLGIDISPIIVFLIIYFLNSFLVQTLLDLAIRIK